VWGSKGSTAPTLSRVGKTHDCRHRYQLEPGRGWRLRLRFQGERGLTSTHGRRLGHLGGWAGGGACAAPTQPCEASGGDRAEQAAMSRNGGKLRDPRSKTLCLRQGDREECRRSGPATQRDRSADDILAERHAIRRRPDWGLQSDCGTYRVAPALTSAAYARRWASAGPVALRFNSWCCRWNRCQRFARGSPVWPHPASASAWSIRSHPGNDLGRASARVWRMPSKLA
jgi:hypothetical protein